MNQRIWNLILKKITIPGTYQLLGYQLYERWNPTYSIDFTSHVIVMYDRADGELCVFEGTQILEEWPVARQRYEGRTWEILILGNIAPFEERWCAPWKVRAVEPSPQWVYRDIETGWTDRTSH